MSHQILIVVVSLLSALGVGTFSWYTYKKHKSAKLLHKHLCTLPSSTLHTLFVDTYTPQPWFSEHTGSPKLITFLDQQYHDNDRSYQNAGFTYNAIWGYRPSVFRFDYADNMGYYDMYAACDANMKMQAHYIVTEHADLLCSAILQLQENQSHTAGMMHLTDHIDLMKIYTHVVGSTHRGTIQSTTLRAFADALPDSATKPLLQRAFKNTTKHMYPCELMRFIDVVNHILQEWRTSSLDVDRSANRTIQEMLGDKLYCKIQYDNPLIKMLTGKAAKPLVRQ